MHVPAVQDSKTWSLNTLPSTICNIFFITAKMRKFSSKNLQKLAPKKLVFSIDSPPYFRRDGRVRRLAMPALPGRLVLLVRRWVEARGVVALDAAGALDQVVVGLALELAARADGRAVVAGPRAAPVHEDRELRRRARVVHRGPARAAPAQLLRGRLFRRRVVVARGRCSQALSADGQGRG